MPGIEAAHNEPRDERFAGPASRSMGGARKPVATFRDGPAALLKVRLVCVATFAEIHGFH